MFHAVVIKVFIIILMVVNLVTPSISSKFEFMGIMPCATDDDCSIFQNSTCEKPTCVCNGRKLCQIQINKIVTKIGETCETSNDCNIDAAECRQYRCECKDGYVQSTDSKKCLIVSEGINSGCEDSSQCYHKVPDSVCRNNKCICEGKHEFQGLCYKSVGLGEACESDPECSIIQFSKCLDSVCSCDAGYVASKNESLCLKVVEGNNSICIDNAQCTATLGEYSHCIEGECRCKELYHYKDRINKCIEDRLLGDVCTVHSDCHDPYPEKHDRLECVAGVCACRSFLREQGGICIDDSENGSSRVSIVFFYLVMCLVNFL
ncbi:prion-like-(Q/N-rich) domain-bearing protein 25 [Diorhabda sublineata]|uniref:prion-like-(Q/N-rich) domain-bearing protein 25 n=1 Tax=Diorhabda sublineata TaxID=1163346 RepID=UPI0024E17F7B|nr:prion-like-(Q/N-rich) domain-bearing protein 25 [Diorhabda sublineata]